MRNWDYRFCWLRDATLILLALMDAGYHDEAQAWREWLLRAVAGSPDQVQIMYGIAGERRLTEWEVPWLPGYEGSAPVRIGNAAHGQLQLDVFGEVMDALHQARCHGIAASESGWDLQQAFLSHLERVWVEPDEGIWEVRGEPKHFTYSKVMAWVAFDRAIKSAEQFDLDGPIDRWREIAATIHADVCRRGYDPELGQLRPVLWRKAAGREPAAHPACRLSAARRSARARHLGGDREALCWSTDSSCATTPRPSDDGLPPGEGAFLACSFWLVDAYVLQHRWQDARELFDRLLALRNDVGLLSEEYDPRTRRLVGNFPQAFTHVALVSSAFNLTRFEKPAEQRARPATEDLADRRRRLAGAQRIGLRAVPKRVIRPGR